MGLLGELAFAVGARRFRYAHVVEAARRVGRLGAGRGAPTTSHRPSTVRDADVIVVLDKGRIVEQGAHEELMSRRGLYWYLVSQQLEL